MAGPFFSAFFSAAPASDPERPAMARPRAERAWMRMDFMPPVSARSRARSTRAGSQRGSRDEALQNRALNQESPRGRVPVEHLAREVNPWKRLGAQALIQFAHLQ